MADNANELKDEDGIPTSSPEVATKDMQPKHSNTKSHSLWIFTFIIIIAGAAWLCLWFFYLQYYESTDDAYVNGNLIILNSAIPGSVQAFYADNTDLVVEGQLLVQLDDTEYRLAYDTEVAALATIVSQVKQLHDTVLVNRALVDNKKVLMGNAKYNFENRSHLIDSKAVSDEDFVHAQDDLKVARLELQQAELQLQAALDATENTRAENHSSIEQQAAKVRTAYYNLQRCSIYAPATGYIAQRSVNVGQRTTQTTQLMAIIPTDYMWVDANFKETQLKYMRIGQPAEVWFDLYGSETKFAGKVLGIASGTGSVFSIIPPQNATGNWIKIVQRLPVRIGLDPKMLKEYPLRLGISATANVDITDVNLPMLATVPSEKPVASTEVFEVDFQEADQEIETVIHRILSPKEVQSLSQKKS